MSNVIPFPTSRQDRRDKAKGGNMINEYKLYVRNETESASTIRIRYHYVDRLTADLDVTTATEAQLETWLRSHGWSPTSINCALASIRHFYRWAERYGHITDNPTRWLRRVRVPRKMGRIAADETIQYGAMNAALPTRIMVMLGAECGLRRAEIAKVHRDDFEDDWLYVVGKGGHQRMVHLSPELHELITAHLKRLDTGAGWLFPNRAGDHHVAPETVYQRIKRAIGVNPHSLRHRAGTAVFERTGNNLRLAQEFLGHASPEMTARYVHITRHDLIRASAAARLAA